MARAAALPPRTQDLALALALAVVNVGSVLPYRSQMHPFWVALLLVIAQAVPLAWRRTWPFTVLILAGVPRILYDQLGFGYAPIPLASTIAFYTAMVHCRPAVRRLVIVLAVIGTTQSQVAPGHNQPYDAIVSVLTTLTAWLAAVAAAETLAATFDVASATYAMVALCKVTAPPIAALTSAVVTVGGGFGSALSAAWIVALARSSVNSTIGRGCCALTNDSCSSVSLVGESESMMMTSGCIAATRSSSASADIDSSTTSYPADVRLSLSRLTSLWESSTSMTRSIRFGASGVSNQSTLSSFDHRQRSSHELQNNRNQFLE
jgi:hypothetical protein